MNNKELSQIAAEAARAIAENYFGKNFDAEILAAPVEEITPIIQSAIDEATESLRNENVNLLRSLNAAQGEIIEMKTARQLSSRAAQGIDDTAERLKMANDVISGTTGISEAVNDQRGIHAACFPATSENETAGVQVPAANPVRKDQLSESLPQLYRKATIEDTKTIPDKILNFHVVAVGIGKTSTQP